MVNPAVYVWHNLTSGDPVPNPPPKWISGRTVVGNAPTYTVGSPGAQTFTMAGREDGLIMDTFVLSTEAAMTESALNSLISIGFPSSAYADAVMALSPTHYYQLNEVSGSTAPDTGTGTTIDGTKGGVDGIFGVPGPNPSDGFSGMSDTNLAYRVNESAIDLGAGSPNFAAEQMTVSM